MEEQEWNDIDQKALSKIQLSITNDVLQEVISETTIMELLNKLESLYMKKTMANRLGALQKLYMLHMQEDTSIRKYVSEFTSLVMDLKNMNEMFVDEQQAMMLLCSLLPSYKNFRETLIYGRKSLAIDVVKLALLSREQMEHDSRRDDPATGLFARERTRDVGSSSHDKGKCRSKSRKRRGKCYYCKKEGHWKRQCLKLKEKKEVYIGNVATVTEGDKHRSLCSYDFS